MNENKMGLKHVILQRIKHKNSNNLIAYNSEQNNNLMNKQITDFSIRRILEDYPKTLENSKKQQTEILDLSKSGYNLKIDQNIIDLKKIGGLLLPTPSSDFLVKPKVIKFENTCNGCSDCDLYLRKMNFYHQQYYIYQQQQQQEQQQQQQQQQSQQHNTILEKDLLLNYGHGNSWANTNRKESIEKNLILQKNTIKLIQNTPKLKVTSNLYQMHSSFLNNDEFSFRCQICDKVFGSADTLQAHEKTHKSPRYECIDCGKGFSQLRNYKYHISVHRGTKEFAAECPECNKTFNDKGYLSSHMKIHRNRKEYECSFCPKSFNQRVAFNMHVRIHTGVKPHKCPECGKRFSRKMLLKQHQRTHSGEKPYNCSVCGKAFADRSNMTLHHRLHSGIKPFACMLCPKAFTKKHHLKTHLNYHTGCKPYICPHKNCNQAFTQSSNMRTHAKKCQFKSSDLLLV